MGSALCCLSCLATKDIDNRKNAGLREKRSCTDSICFILYFLTVVGFLGLAVIAFFQGNFLGPVRDSYGRVCNTTDTVTAEKPYLYSENPDDYISSLFFRSHAASLNSICVSNCPTHEFNAVEITVGAEKSFENDELICHDKSKFNEVYTDDKSFEEAIIAGECMKFIVPTIPFNSRCLPDVTKIPDTIDNIASVANISVSNWFNQSMTDVENSWQFIIAILGGAAFFSFVITLLMRWLSGVSVWFCITIFIAGVGSLVGFAAYKYKVLEGSAFSDTPLNEVPFMQWDSQRRFWLYILIASSIVLFIILLIVIGIRKRIRNSIQVMKMASRALSSTPATAIFPIVPFIFAIISLGVFVVGFLSLHTMDKVLEAEYLQWLSTNALLFKFVFIFIVIWIIGFISGFQRVTLAGVYAEYYWTGSSSLASGFWRAFRYHMGTIAFGSFVLACLRFIIVVLSLLIKSKRLTKKLKKVAACLACIVQCIERIVNYVTDRTYIMLAIKGKGYCRSASTAMQLIVRNPINSLVLDKSAFFVLWVARLIVMGTSVSIGYFLFYVWNEELHEVIVNKYVILIIIAIGSLIVAHPFFLVHSVAIDTTFFCFLEDCEINDGTPEKPYANRYTQKYFGKRIRKLHAKHGENAKAATAPSKAELTEMK